MIKKLKNLTHRANKNVDMGTKKRNILIAAVLIALVGVFALIDVFAFKRSHEAVRVKVAAPSTLSAQDASAKIAHCHGAAGGAEAEIDCIFGDLKGTLLEGDIATGMSIFDAAYRDFPSFAETGCHKQAHRVGDTVYYNYTIARGIDIKGMSFPQITTACGYGFFHGFLEHYTQDHPTPAVITDTCEYLRSAYGKDMGDIGQTCYHGSGHGLEYAQSEKVAKADFGKARMFVDVPLAQCQALSKANASEKEDCQEGVFNVIVNFMVDNNFGFSYPKDPMGWCKEAAPGNERPCIAEVSQKFDSFSGMDPVKLREIVKSAPNEELSAVAFQTGVAGIIQQRVTKGNGYDETLTQCMKLDNTYFRFCADSIIHGLFEHGEPQVEYKKPLAMCKDPRIAEKGFEKECYNDIISRMPRFYSPEQRIKICAEFPASYQAVCK